MDSGQRTRCIKALQRRGSDESQYFSGREPGDQRSSDLLFDHREATQNGAAAKHAARWLTLSLLAFSCLAPRAWSQAPGNYQATDKPVETFYQQVEIQRLPQFSIRGLFIRQQIRYRIVSTFELFAPDASGKQLVVQTVVDAVLVQADALSRAAFEQTLNGMRDKQFRFQIDRFGQLTMLEDVASNVQNVEIKKPKSQGTLMTSVIDADGWKELASLTLFQPPTGRSTRSFNRRTTHDWGALGSWYGKTDFRGKTEGRNRKRFSYVHKLEYIPPSDETREDPNLPFTINSANFRTYEAQGQIMYDTKEKRAISAREVFHAKGTILANMLGVDTRIDLQERQLYDIQITRQRSLRFLDPNREQNASPNQNANPNQNLGARSDEMIEDDQVSPARNR